MAVNFKDEHKKRHEYLFQPETILVKPELNGRHDNPEIEWLVKDILEHGQHTPIVIRNDGGQAVLVAGFSRWRAISEINKRNLAPMKMALRCTYVQCNEAEAFLLNISENRFRNPTTPIDDAHNIKRLINVYAMTEDAIAGIYFPTAKTEAELKEARKFIKSRIALISLSPESAAAVKEGRVSETAAVAISKLNEAQQKEVLKKKGNIERKDVTGAKGKKVKPVVVDAELRRRVTLMLEDVAGLLDPKDEYTEIETKLLIALEDYLKIK